MRELILSIEFSEYFGGVEAEEVFFWIEEILPIFLWGCLKVGDAWLSSTLKLIFLFYVSRLLAGYLIILEGVFFAVYIGFESFLAVE